MHRFLSFSREAIAQQLDREPRRRRALAGEDLVRRYRAGLLQDHGHVSDWLALTSLLAEDDPLFCRCLTYPFQRTENLPTAKRRG